MKYFVIMDIMDGTGTYDARYFYWHIWAYHLFQIYCRFVRVSFFSASCLAMPTRK